MGIEEKLASAKTTNWISEGISEAEIKTTVELAKISAKIERRRIDMGMTQKEFADYMGVTQGMVSKWESREYNFTIRTLNEICKKIDLDLRVNIDKPFSNTDYAVIKWNTERRKNNTNNNGWSRFVNNKEAIA